MNALPPGAHEIKFGGHNPTFELSVSYDLVICETDACMNPPSNAPPS